MRPLTTPRTAVKPETRDAISANGSRRRVTTSRKGGRVPAARASHPDRGKGPADGRKGRTAESAVPRRARAAGKAGDAHHAVVRERAQLLSIFDGIDEVVYISDPRTHEILYLNGAARAVFGDAVGKKCYRAFQRRRTPCPFCTNRIIFHKRPGEPHIWEFQNLRNRRWYRCIDKAIPWPDGRLVRYEMALDVTDMKQAEEALRSSEKRYRATIDSLAEAIHMVGPDLRIILANRAFTVWAARMGLRGGLVGRTVRTAFPFLPATVEEEYRNVFRTGRMLRTEERCLIHGRETITETRKIPVLEEGKTVHVITAISNITARRKAEEAIRRSEKKYRSLMEGANDAIFLADENGMLLEVNRRAIELVGRSRRELLGTHITRLHPPEERDRIVAAFREIAERGAGSAGDVTILCGNGKTVPVEISVSAIRHGGATLMHAIMRDVSERKRIEAMRDLLLRDVTHELKTPIAMMKMAHAMANEALAACDLEGVRRAEGIAARNLAFLARDVGNILGMCWLRGGTLILKPAPLSLGGIAGEIAEEMRDRLRLGGVGLEVRIKRGADRITAERRMIRTLLYNLVDNALKFTRRGKVTIGASRTGGWVTLTVRDTGIGIASAAREEVFTPFYKKNPAMQGTGLGLPICREIAKLHGGTVRISSNGRRKGTTVAVRLAVRPAASRRAGKGGVR